MPLQIDDSKATHLFFAQEVRICPACGEEQQYGYKSSGHYFYRLFGLQYVDGQIVYCHNGACHLRFKPMHPPEELSQVQPKKGHGFDVIARVGQLRYGEKLTRLEIKARLAENYPELVISERQVENLYEFYGALVSGSTLTDPDVIARIKANKCMVLSFDGGKPIRDNDSVWFVRDLLSGTTLAALAMTSCTTEALVKVLTPIKEFARRHNTPVIAIVSDKEPKNLAAAQAVFPKVRHQYCQVHYVGNLAEPVAKADRELRNDVKEAMRGKVGEIEKAIKEDTGSKKSLKADESAVLLDLCEGIRSLLRRNGKQPYDPPGIRLVEDLIELREAVRKMKREKGGAHYQALEDVLSLAERFQPRGHAIQRFYDDIRSVGEILFSDGQTKKGAKRLLQKLRKTWERRILHPRCEDDVKAEPVLRKWCEQTESYWPGLFHCYGDYRIPGSNNDIERFIKDMKQLERVLSGNPNPATRFIRHAATNALLATRPVLPDERTLASYSAETIREATRQLRERRGTMGIQRQVRRSPKRFGEALLKRLRQALSQAGSV